VTDGLAIRPLSRGEWPDAMTLAARVFSEEPFMTEIFGPEPIRRFEGALRLFYASDWHDEEMHLGAFVGGVMVGLSVAAPQGACRICSHVDPTRPPDDPDLAVDWQFEVNVQAAHSDQGLHGWLGKVLVDPALRGGGIGRGLVAESVSHVRDDGPTAVLLECQPHRESLYLSCGFHHVRTFPDPAGPPAVLMRADLDPRG
jgi:GNAT superfamily N-acetyltransferase